MTDPRPGLLVLPRMPDTLTGAGQRSLVFVQAAARLGPVHVALVDGAGSRDELERIDGVVGIHVVPSNRLNPRGKLSQKLLGIKRVLAPKASYALDRPFQAGLLALLKETGAQYVLFRYARLFCVAGLPKTAGVKRLVDVDDRDDLKYRSRLEQRLPAAAMGLVAPLLGRLRGLLKRRLETADQVWFTGTNERFDLATPVAVIPNVPFAAPDTVLPLEEASTTVLFVGSFAHGPNRQGLRWLLDTTWSLIQSAAPETRLRVVGRGNWHSLSGEYSHLENVDFVGSVDDLTAEYARARLVVCPILEGAGSNIKLIEAAAFARPIVATPFAVRGFGPEISQTVGVADTAADFAAACLRYLGDDDLSRRDGGRLRAAQTDHYTKEAVLGRITDDIAAAMTAKEHSG